MKKIIYGYGITGKAVERYLADQGCEYYIVDGRKTENIINPAEFYYFDECDEIYVSPGISPGDSFVIKCIENGIKVTSEIDKAYSILKDSVFIAVTGTNGKSTVCALIYEFLKNQYDNVFIGGNFGTPLIDFSYCSDTKNIFVVELSSYQLEYCQEFTPDVAILLNLTPDHLGRHNTMENYRITKEKIFRNMHKGLVLYNPTAFSISERKPDMTYFALGKDFDFDGESFVEHSLIINRLETILPGQHNLANIAFSIGAAVYLNVKESVIKDTLGKFRGLEHRIEYCGQKSDIIFYNDSKSTTFESTYAAVKSFDSDIFLIICGKLKDGMDIERFLDTLSGERNIKKIFAVGDICSFINSDPGEKVVFYRNYDMRDIFDNIVKNSDNRSVALFSPGMPSFDNFSNFEERGRFFKEKVMEYIKK